MNGLQSYNYEGTYMRTISKDEELWWVLKDVCDVLGLSNSRMAADRLDADEKGVSIIDTPGGKQELTVINESGLYNIIMLSRKPEAKKFKRWVTHEVLPSIRKHGAYMTPQTIEDVLLDPDTIIRLATELKKERTQRIELETKVERDAPLVLFAKSVDASDTTILIGDLAKLIKQNGVDVGQNRLFEWMRDNGYLIKHGDSRNSPTQRAMELGLFWVRESTVNNPDGSVRITKTTKVTGKGQQYFLNKFLALVPA